MHHDPRSAGPCIVVLVRALRETVRCVGPFWREEEVQGVRERGREGERGNKAWLKAELDPQTVSVFRHITRLARHTLHSPHTGWSGQVLE